MPPAVSLDRLALAAFWYYVQDMSQAEVASRLHTSRSNVSRLLRAAREKGIIQFEILHPIRRDLAVEEQLSRRFGAAGLREVIVSASPGEHFSEAHQEAGMLAVARAASDWLNDNLQDGQTLGLFWGGTVRTVVDVARFTRRIDAHIVQLGGEWSDEPHRSGHNLVRDLAGKLGGRYTYFSAPAFTASASDTESLLAEPAVARALELARESDVCMVGVGAFTGATTALFVAQADATAQELAEAHDRGVVGQMAGRFFDAQGEQADISLHRRLVSLDLAEVQKVATVVVVASGAGKARAVESAIRGRLISTLICDADLGAALAGR